MRIGAFLLTPAMVGMASLCAAEPPVGPIVSNPYFQAAPSDAPGTRVERIESSPSATTAAYSQPLRLVMAVPEPSSPSVVAVRRDVPLQALSAAFVTAPAAAGRAEPRRFVPSADAAPLVAANGRTFRRDASVLPAIAEQAEPSTTASSVGDKHATVNSLSAAVAAQFQVTRLAANPLRGREPGAEGRPMREANDANPLR